MTRGIDSSTNTALQQPHVTGFLLLELAFGTGTQYLTDAPHSVDWSDHTYLSARGVGSVEAITETAEGAQGLRFTLAGATQAAIASALADDVQGVPVVVRQAIVDAGTLRVDPNVWSGTLDVMQVADGAQPVITVTAEHEMLAWQTPSGALFSHQEQQRIDPTDMFFEFAASMAEATLVWPTKDAL
jgi:hypothetical protein